MTGRELLPCPFCGSAPRFDSGHGDAVCVLCGECGASSDFCNAGHEAEAASAWNTRANLAPLQAENERLRAEVDALREALREAHTRIAAIGYPASPDGKYNKNGEWTFSDAVPRAVDAGEVEAAFLVIRTALAAYRKGGKQ